VWSSGVDDKDAVYGVRCDEWYGSGKTKSQDPPSVVSLKDDKLERISVDIEDVKR